MYITYNTLQYTVDDQYGHCSKDPSLSPATHFTPEPPRSGLPEVHEFRPTWLIRIEDMKKVCGSDVHEPYYALSYSWNQSGDILPGDGSEKYTRIDEGKHKIISYPEGIVQGETSVKTRLVNFEELIQQICRDFNAQYIWYDQLCIDQGNPAEKRREIQQMHKIYSHAQCTVVLVPELRTFFPEWKSYKPMANVEAIATSEWSKRAWTLEEAFMSKRLLFVGQDTHLWSYLYDRARITNLYVGGRSFAILYDICTKAEEWTASTVLWHARRRTSTKLHDRIFALANIFPTVTEGLSFDYDEPLLSATLHFYGLLAQSDLSILCFGTPFLIGSEEDVDLQQQEHKLQLPSWTGANGSHATSLQANRNIFDAPGISWTVSEQLLHLTCKCIHVAIVQGEYRLSKTLNRHEEVVGTASLPPHTSPHDSNSLLFMKDAEHLHTGSHPFNTNYAGLKATHCLSIEEGNISGTCIDTSTLNPVDFAFNTVLSLTDTSCKECIILTGLAFSFKSLDEVTGVMPVIQQTDDGYYRCVGSCIEVIDELKLENIKRSHPNLESKQTFTIK